VHIVGFFYKNVTMHGHLYVKTIALVTWCSIIYNITFCRRVVYSYYKKY